MFNSMMKISGVPEKYEDTSTDHPSISIMTFTRLQEYFIPDTAVKFTFSHVAQNKVFVLNYVLYVPPF